MKSNIKNKMRRFPEIVNQLEEAPKPGENSGINAGSIKSKPQTK